MRVGRFFCSWCGFIAHDTNEQSKNLFKPIPRRSPHTVSTTVLSDRYPAHDSITITRNSPLISCVQRKRPGEYWIHGGSFNGGGGCGRRSTAEEAADYLSQSPHWAVLMRLIKELRWEDVHRYLGLTEYGFVPRSLPMPES
jgi:hypothetical protein